MKIKRKLPDPPRPATRAVFQKEVVGEGKYTRTIDRPQKLKVTPGKWPRSAPKKKAEPKARTESKQVLRGKENARKVAEMFGKGCSKDEIMCETGLSRTTVDRYIRQAYGLQYRAPREHDAEIIRMFNDGTSIADMSEALSVPDHYIRNMLRRLRNEGKIGWRYRRWEERLSE